jgi:type I restriction-modification system DNA methylase subunit
MNTATDMRQSIITALGNFASQPLRSASEHFFAALGYSSPRTLPIHSLDQLQLLLDPNGLLTEDNAYLSRWQALEFLFQLTQSELVDDNGQRLLLHVEAAYDAKVVKSYIFIAVQLALHPNGEPPRRTELSNITRAINRLVPMPVLVLFKHGEAISLAVINRRKNLRDGTRDVLTRVSLIRNIDCRQPHRAHLELLNRLSVHGLREDFGSIRTFADLDNAWQRTLSTQELNERFYRELVDWFRWAVGEIRLARLPDHTPDDPSHRARATQEFTVRLICRTLFAWFLKEMRLIPSELLELYDVADRRRVLTLGTADRHYLDGNHYYRGILQNIFFQALNQPMNRRRKSGPEAASDRTVTRADLKELAYLGKNQLPDDFNYDLFDRIPYLNGGLFDKLTEDNASDTIDDGAFRIPNKLFFAHREDGFTIEVGTGRRQSRRAVEGLNRIFDRYRFTVAENTPLEEDVALDPELLGLVFENLLAEIDPDDKAAAESARKASGSYYTPRRIVDYMVNEALHLHLRTRFAQGDASREDTQLLARLCYEQPDDVDFSPIADRVVDALDAVRVLDPACGSGAFPMGMLHRMVELLAWVDNDNERWKQRLLARLPAEVRADAAWGMEGKSYNYLRKLGLIQKNLYGLDIQPLASLIAKLRFFLTLVIEQDVHPTDRAHNYGLQALPNLETNLLCCNSLQDAGHGLLSGPVLANLRAAREEYYQPGTTRERRDEIAAQIGGELAALYPGFAEQAKGIKPPPVDEARGFTRTDRENARRSQDAAWLAEWFKHATLAAPFFNVETFFPELVGDGASRNPAPFHIVIGNPPYGVDVDDTVREPLGLASKDSYGAFIARFLGTVRRPGPLAEGGVLAYIVSDTFMTIKSHRPLREQMLEHRVHKMIRVAADTFNAVVNCAVILCQRGAAPAGQTCQMADFTNVSIHDQYERFLHLLYQTEGFSRRQNVANQTYAIYHYPQSIIRTNSNFPFFVASPKLFALMLDVGNEVRVTEQGLPAIAYNVSLNGQAMRVFKLGDQYSGMGRTRRWLNRGLFQVISGIKTGGNAKYLRLLSEDAQKNFDLIEPNVFLDDADAIALPDEQKQNGITGQSCFVRFEMGMPADTDNGLLPCYHQSPSQIAIDWSRDSIARMRTEAHSDLANAEFRFQPFDQQISFSFAGQYCPTFRRANAPVFLNAASRIFLRPEFHSHDWLGVLNSKFFRYLTRELINHTVNFGVDDIKEAPVLIDRPNLRELVAAILLAQQRNAAYDYASNEQVEIDRMVYAAYGLNEADVREVEDWYARRYKTLADAQRKNLAAKQGKTEEQIITRTTLHLYCDESRHLPHDSEPSLLLGLLECPAERAHALNAQLSALWAQHGLPKHFEAKWTKVSPGKLGFYRAVLEWFVATEDVSFRALVLPDKQQVFTRVPKEKREDIYYSLYYELLKNTITPGNSYRAFLDIKDTRGREKLDELGRWLEMNYPSLKKEERPQLQHVRSHEIRLLQVTDLLLGAVGFARRPVAANDSAAKRALVSLLEEKLNQKLTANSQAGMDKFSIESVDGLLL